jgi:large subunit ribosomal protein L13
MAKLQKSTLLSKEAAEDQREWYVVDLKDQILGRAATRIATVLRGKHKPTYTPNVDCGDFVVVINAGQVKLTGNKETGKIYRHHTLFPGGLVEIPAGKLLATHPDRAIRRAVWGMLPKGPLGRRLIKKLKIYAGGEHEHAAQQPRPLAL